MIRKFFFILYFCISELVFFRLCFRVHKTKTTWWHRPLDVDHKPFKIIIILSCYHHRYPWPSLVTPPYRSSLPGRSSGLHPVSSQSSCILVRGGRPVFARPCEEVHRSTSLMSSSLLLQQCPACLVRLTWIVFVMGGKWPYSCCFVGCCLQDLFNIARSILV